MDTTNILERDSMNYAALQKGMVAVSKPSSSYTFTKDQIQRALNSKDSASLRLQSQYFYVASGEYRRLVEYYGKLFSQEFIITPRVESTDFTKPAFKKAFDEILKYSRSSAIAETCMDIATLVVRDGVFYGYERIGADTITMQPLPTEYCRTRFKMHGVLLVEFDFSYFNQFRNEADLLETLNAFPPEFTGLYNAFKSDSTKRWVLLDPQYARCHMLWDGTPLLSAIFLDLIDLGDYKAMEKVKSGLDIYKLIIQKIPTDKDGNVTMLMPEIEMLHTNFRKMVSNLAVDVITTPADVVSVEVGADKAQGVTDAISKGKDAVYSSSGTSVALFNSGSKTGSVGLEASQKTDESLMSPLLKQFERWYDYKFSAMSSKYAFGATFLPVTFLNKEKQFSMYKDAAALGFPTKIMAAVTAGLKQHDVSFMIDYENVFLNLPERMIPLSSSFNGGAEESEGGRPTSTDPLSDEGQAAKDGDKNANRA